MRSVKLSCGRGGPAMESLRRGGEDAKEDAAAASDVDGTFVGGENDLAEWARAAGVTNGEMREAVDAAGVG